MSQGPHSPRFPTLSFDLFLVASGEVLLIEKSSGDKLADRPLLLKQKSAGAPTRPSSEGSSVCPFSCPLGYDALPRASLGDLIGFNFGGLHDAI